jgi:cytochrome c5
MTTTTTTTTTVPTTTAGELAISGKTLYNKTCTFSDCHARFIEGGEFSSPDVSQFANAEVVFNIISSIMHLGISDMEEEAPSEEEYLEILAFLLIQDDFIQPGDLFSRNNLSNVLIEQPQTTTTTTPATTTPMATWGELAERGAQTFSGDCGICHYPGGGGGDEGPIIIGTTLRSFGTAQRLFNYISTRMPRNDPGSLSGADYLRVLAFMITESGFVQAEDIFDAENLPNVIME